MVFTILNISTITINIFGIGLAPKTRFNLLSIATAAQIKSSLKFGELYKLLMGRMVVAVDIYQSYIDLAPTQDEWDFYSYCGFLQGRKEEDRLNHPFAFSADGYLKTNVYGITLDASGIAVDVRGDRPVPSDRDSVLAMGTEDGYYSGTVHTLKIGSDGYLQTKDIIHGVVRGNTPEIDVTGRNIGSDVAALDVFDNAPTQAIYNYSTARGDGSAVRINNTTLTLSITAPLVLPTSVQLCRVRVITTAAAKPLVWEQGRNAVLTIAVGVVTVVTFDGTTIPIPAATTDIEVMWAGPDKGVAFEDVAHVPGEYGNKNLRRRVDSPTSSAGSDGDWATANQDADGFDYVRDKAYDTPTAANRTFEIAPLWSKAVSAPISIIAAAQNFTNSWVDLGPEIATMGYSRIGLWLNVAVNNSTNMRIKCLAKHTSAGSNEYAFPLTLVDVTGTPFFNRVQAEYTQLDNNASQMILLTYQLENLISYCQFQIQVEAVGTPTAAQVLDCVVTYAFI